MDLDVAGGNFGIREKFDDPVVVGDLIFLETARGAPAEFSRLGILLGHVAAQRALCVLGDQVKNSRQPGVIFGVQIHAEYAGE